MFTSTDGRETTFRTEREMKARKRKHNNKQFGCWRLPTGCCRCCRSNATEMEQPLLYISCKSMPFSTFCFAMPSRHRQTTFHGIRETKSTLLTRKKKKKKRTPPPPPPHLHIENKSCRGLTGWWTRERPATLLSLHHGVPVGHPPPPALPVYRELETAS